MQIPDDRKREQFTKILSNYAGIKHKKTDEVAAPMKTLDAILGRDYFAKPSAEVAQGLLGREIVRHFKGGEVRGIIKEMSAWDGVTKTSSDSMLYAPGTIGVSQKFGKYLMDIATELSGVSSCVTLIAAEFDWQGKKQLVEGPGNVTKALRIDRALDGLKIYENDQIYIVGGKIPAQQVLQRTKKNVPSNCKGYFYILPQG